MVMFYPLVWFVITLFSVRALDDSYFNRAFQSFDYILVLQKHFTKDFVKQAIQNQSDYLHKSPFPYTYVDGLFPQKVLMTAEKEIPDNRKLKNGCIPGAQCFMDDNQNSMLAIADEKYMGPATAALFTFMRSTIFIKYLEGLTGIGNLIPDPHYQDSGILQTLHGGHVNIHADLNQYPKYDMHRRVKVFLFLNPEWLESYGGHLEFWSTDLKNCNAKILPTLGRLVVFSSTDSSYHGHPVPLTSPPNRSRRSLAMYFYTRTRPPKECAHGDCQNSHTTLFQSTACKSCDAPKCKAY